jgi:hypothetical protein
MFVCDECILNYYVHFDDGWSLIKNPQRFTARSLGPCEDCGKVKSCIDVPHSRYAHKDSVYAKGILGAATE